ncbi:MAG: PrgI family protein [Candidatus Nomurabacteria bacterium]|nr:PrgI family protein [Candidatus Nomurabacteria bacterium]
MQFKVPQFLDIEDKIFGPFTFKEFVYLAGGAGLCFVLYKLLGLFLGAIPILIVAGFSIALARYRPNNKPFIDMIEAAFNYSFQSKLYIWKRRTKKIDKNKQVGQTLENTEGREKLENSVRLGGNKLRDLAWSLDVLDLSKHINNK